MLYLWGMAGIYLHIPFCKQACNYCDFYFSTRKSLIPDFVTALLTEIRLQKNYFPEGTILQSLYLGGGTPSLLDAHDLEKIFSALRENFALHPSAEITLEANPDDLSADKVRSWKELGINRLSLGLQSLSDTDLKFMHRAHSREESLNAVNTALQGGISRLSLDFIFGIPGSGDAQWQNNLEFIRNSGVSHFSAYALTVEPKTRLAKEIRSGKVPLPPEEDMVRQFLYLQEFAQQNRFIPYEISNYALPGNEAVHNTAYWYQKPYLGLGPSAHSFTNPLRKYNLPDLKNYIAFLQEGKMPPAESEILNATDQVNEFIMTRIRLAEGISLAEYQKLFGHSLENRCGKWMQEYFNSGDLIQDNHVWKLSLTGRLLADRIASEMFMEESEAEY